MQCSEGSIGPFSFSAVVFFEVTFGLLNVGAGVHQEAGQRARASVTPALSTCYAPLHGRRKTN